MPAQKQQARKKKNPPHQKNAKETNTHSHTHTGEISGGGTLYCYNILSNKKADYIIENEAIKNE